jgi:hypothetical protein
MTSQRAPSPIWAWLAAYALLQALTIATAVSVSITPGAATLTKHLLHLALTATHNPPPTMGGVLSITVNNTQRGAWPLLLGPFDLPRRRWALTLADTAVLATLAGAALLVGSALGAYGSRAATYLPHLPLEYAGLATCAGAWLVDRRQPLTTRQRMAAFALTTTLFLCAAGIETTLVPHR